MSKPDSGGCPSCGSTRTLSELKKKRVAVEKRIEEQKKPLPSSTFQWSVIPLKNNVLIGPNSNSATTGNYSVAVGEGASAYGHWSTCIGSFTTAGSHALALGNESNALDGETVINGAVVEFCIDCGTMYSPGLKKWAENFHEETLRMDPLGELADIE